MTKGCRVVMEHCSTWSLSVTSSRQRAHESAAARREQIQAVAAFQHTDDRTRAYALAQCCRPVGDVVGLQCEFSEWIPGERVETGGDQQCIRVPVLERRVDTGEEIACVGGTRQAAPPAACEHRAATAAGA